MNFSNMKRMGLGIAAGLGALALTTGSAFAAAPKIDSGDTAWMLTSSALVLMMTIPGLALFYARHGAQEEHACDGRAEFRRDLHHHGTLDGDRLFGRVHNPSRSEPQQVHRQLQLLPAWANGTERDQLAGADHS